MLFEGISDQIQQGMSHAYEMIHSAKTSTTKGAGRGVLLTAEKGCAAGPKTNSHSPVAQQNTRAESTQCSKMAKILQKPHLYSLGKKDFCNSETPIYKGFQIHTFENKLKIRNECRNRSEFNSKRT